MTNLDFVAVKSLIIQTCVYPFPRNLFFWM